MAASAVFNIALGPQKKHSAIALGVLYTPTLRIGHVDLVCKWRGGNRHRCDKERIAAREQEMLRVQRQMETELDSRWKYAA